MSTGGLFGLGEADPPMYWRAARDRPGRQAQGELRRVTARLKATVSRSETQTADGTAYLCSGSQPTSND